MTRKDFTRHAPLSGVASVAAGLVLDFTNLLAYEWWEIALSFPLGAAFYLLVEFLCERIPVSNKDGAK